MGILERIFPKRRETASPRNSAAEDSLGVAAVGTFRSCDRRGSVADAAIRDSDGEAAQREREAEKGERSADEGIGGDEIALQQYIQSHVELR